jgi:hypothetical protein
MEVSRLDNVREGFCTYAKVAIGSETERIDTETEK